MTSILASWHRGSLRRALLVAVLVALAVTGTPPHEVEAAGMVVTTAADDTAADGQCSLREAMTNAGDNNPTHADCPAGDATGDTITFAAGLAGATITLGATLPDVNVLVGDSVTIDATGQNITISGNSTFGILTVNGGGGGGATAELRGLTFRDARGANAGAIDNPDGTLTLIDTTFIDNNPSVGTFGGAVRSLGATASLTIRNSTFSGNTASGAGGAVMISSGTATFTNSTFSGNTSPAGLGGAIAVAGGTVSILNSTISANSADNGGGLFTIVPVTLTNSIMANNIAATGPECSGTVTNNLVSLIEDTTGCTVGGGGTLLTGDPALGAFASHGGPVQTIALLDGSPALGVGDAGACAALSGGAFDARGLVRPQGAQCDLGAYEALRVSVAPVAQAEGNGASVFNVPVTLSQALPAGFPSVTVQYDTTNGSATAPADYTAVVAGTVTFSASGPATVTAPVPVNGNTVAAASKNFTMTISNAIRAVITPGGGSAIATITEDDVLAVESPEAPQPSIEVPASTATTTRAPFSLSLRVRDGLAPYRWSVIGGALPPGLQLDDTTGAITGSATMPGSYAVTIRALDSRGIKAELAIRMTVTGSATPLGTFATAPVFNDAGVALTVFTGGSIVQIETAALAAGARGAWAQDDSGMFRLLVVGGPAFLQAPFIAAFPAGAIGPLAVFLIR